MTVQDGLFGDPGPEPVTPSSKKLTGRGTWTRYTSQVRIQCDDCVQVVHDNGGEGGPGIRSTRMILHLPDGQHYLCYAHAELRRTQMGGDR